MKASVVDPDARWVNNGLPDGAGNRYYSGGFFVSEFAMEYEGDIGWNFEVPENVCGWSAGSVNTEILELREPSYYTRLDDFLVNFDMELLEVRHVV